MISWIIKIIKSVRTLPTTKWINKDESYCLNTDLRKIFQMQILPMALVNFLITRIRAFLDTTRSLMESMAPIWKTCRGKRRFKRRGMVPKIAILEELLKGPASATTSTSSKRKRELIVRRTRGRRRAFRIIQAIRAFSPSTAQPARAPFPTLPRNNQTHSNKPHKSPWSNKTSRQW